MSLSETTTDMRCDQNDPQLTTRWHYCSQHTIHPQVE